MEFPKKICSLGILDINLNLILSQKEANLFHFNLSNYNSIEDFKSFFDQKTNQFYFDVLDHFSLSSDNNLINILLFINRAYKNKSFIEFIMPNQLDFSGNTSFFQNLTKYILHKNYFFIIENSINNIPASIKFIIKIYKDNSNSIISTKNFDLFPKNCTKIENDDEKKDKSSGWGPPSSSRPKMFFQEINYNFTASDYFILDLDLFNNDIFNDFVICEEKNIFGFYSEIVDYILNIIKI